MDLILNFSIYSFACLTLMLFYIIGMLIGALVPSKLFKNQNNILFVAMSASFFSIIMNWSLLQQVNEVLYNLNIFNVLFFGQIIYMLMIFIFVVPFVIYGFPDLPVYGRTYLISGFITSILSMLPINAPLDFSIIKNLLNSDALKYISAGFFIWLVAGLAIVSVRVKIAYKIIFKGEVESFDLNRPLP